MSTYPRDEFDKVPENSSRHGVHRTSIAPTRNNLVPLVAFGVLALVVGLVAFFVLPTLGFGPASASPNAVITSGPAATTDAATGAPTEEPKETSAPATSAPAPTTAPPTTAPPAAAVDKTVPVQVFNGSGVGGLAAKYSGIVTGAGWGVYQTANWQGMAQPSSVIFYSGTAQKANAESLAALLGINRLVDTAELGIPLAVVLGPGAF
ncbi:LytR C-terminal domain-containing protein [Arthrobacter sp. 35W]|uniref:LytR C-terminal domain-containing protein n=1 Tax=Arthrobacter sp. 35W TaxID=1132441 RepID=UPI0004122C19|nr:LytR C-terminal domain-containing protein [Arthrobacter sp. 35W]